jgi:hypothetical protein
VLIPTCCFRAAQLDYRFPSSVPVSPQLKELLRAVFVKSREARIGLAELAAHPWVTADGELPPIATTQTPAGGAGPPCRCAAASTLIPCKQTHVCRCTVGLRIPKLAAFHLQCLLGCAQRCLATLGSVQWPVHDALQARHANFGAHRSTGRAGCSRPWAAAPAPTLARYAATAEAEWCHSLTQAHGVPSIGVHFQRCFAELQRGESDGDIVQERKGPSTWLAYTAFAFLLLHRCRIRRPPACGHHKAAAAGCLAPSAGTSRKRRATLPVRIPPLE